jgi:hypothetical protein
MSQTMTVHIGTADLAEALLRLADNLHTVQQCGRWNGGPAPISARLLLFSAVGISAKCGVGEWEQRLREMRSNGTRHLLNPMDDSLRAVLKEHLGGEFGLNFGTGDLYTADQVREVAAKVQTS